jgi:hypothetical protein
MISSASAKPDQLEVTHCFEFVPSQAHNVDQQIKSQDHEYFSHFIDPVVPSGNHDLLVYGRHFPSVFHIFILEISSMDRTVLLPILEHRLS